MPAAEQVREAIRNGSWIRRMFEEGTRMKAELGEERVFDFTLGNPFGDPPAELLAEISRLAAAPPGDLHKYMPNAGFPEVRAKVAESLRHVTGVPFDASGVVMTSGAAGALNVAFRAILSPGDEVVVLAPYFVEYLFYIRNAGAVPVTVETDDRFLPSAAAVAAALTERTRAIVLNTPNNPTGAVYPAETLAAVEAALRVHEERTGRVVYVLSDEPYRKIVYPGAAFAPPASHFRDALVAYSHSKDLNLPGERIGYLAVSPRAADAAEVAEAAVFCNRTLGFVNAPSLLQRAVASFQGLPADMEVYGRNRAVLLSALGEAGFDVVPPGGAFYLFPRSPVPDELELVDAAREEGILVVPGSGFGRKGYFRIAFCVDPAAVERSVPAWKRLGARFAGKGGPR
jgi:aspartate aminotransferase